MRRPKGGTKRIRLNNGAEEWHEFCTKELAYVERKWCSVEDITKLWPEKDSTDGLEMEEHM
jgi:hypothetical protein